jgi:hypothetical protein
MEQKQLTNWQAVGIGALVGLYDIALATLSFLMYGNEFNESSLFFIVVFAVGFSVAGMPLCIIGALLGKYLRASAKATWIGAVIASIPAPAISIYLLANTCWGMC